MNYCIVCGYEIEFELFNNYHEASFESCPCCGFEYGFDDLSSHIEYSKARSNWIINGHKWYPFEVKLVDWPQIVKSQLKNISKIDTKNFPERVKKNNRTWPPISSKSELQELISQFEIKYLIDK